MTPHRPCRFCPILLAVVIAVVIPMVVPRGGASAAEPVVTGPPERVFDWATQRCARWDSPDTPARAWRGPDGRVSLIAGAPDNRLSRGADLDDLHHDCQVVFRGSGSGDPGAYDDRIWLHAVHAGPGDRVIALGHAEYHGHTHPGRCAAATYAACWWNAVVELVSDDGGASFRREGPPVAVTAAPYDGRAGRRMGYFNPSNIVSDGGFLYAFVMAEAAAPQRRGPCLLRRLEAGSAADWRAWDGTGFGVRFADPYAGGPQAEAVSCAPVDGVTSTISGVVRRGAAGSWLAVTPAALEGRSGIWWSVSADLLHWSPPQLLWEAPLLWRRDCAAPAAYAYPALLDPDSPDRDFGRVDEDFWLYLVEMPLGDACGIGPERDLVRLPVSWPEG